MLGSVARKYAHKIPFIVKINHNELLTLPNKFDQVMFGTVKEAHNLGAVAVGATIYFGSTNRPGKLLRFQRLAQERVRHGLHSLVLSPQFEIQDR